MHREFRALAWGRVEEAFIVEQAMRRDPVSRVKMAIAPANLGKPARTDFFPLGVGEVKFTGQVTPAVKKVTYLINMKRVILRGKLVLGVGDGVMEADGRPIYAASDLRVGLFDPKDLV